MYLVRQSALTTRTAARQAAASGMHEVHAGYIAKAVRCADCREVARYLLPEDAFLTQPCDTD